ncbi:MAG: metal ABC transporter permease [Planctomycetes bacterium]|nr:metal ABC transporter permease [Planctomycetota bacterium]
MNWFELPFLRRGFIAVLLIAPLLGGLSHLVVARRLAFLSTALGQAALTGLTIGLALGEPLDEPWGGMTGFCLLLALLMVWLKRRAALPADTLIGVFVAFTLGLGICLLVAVTQRFNVHQIEALMFGSLLTVTHGDLLRLALLLVAVVVVLRRSYNDLLLDSVAPTLAPAYVKNRARLEYLLVIVLTIAIVASLKIVGALLVEALVVIPAAAGRQLATTLRAHLLASIAIAFLGGTGGLALSCAFSVPSGGAVVLALALLFVLAYAVGAVRRARKR